MRTDLTILGLLVVIYPNDHRPAHVHMISPDCEAVLNCAALKGRPNCVRIMAFLDRIWEKIADKFAAELTV
jgi:hypothetical protein